MPYSHQRLSGRGAPRDGQGGEWEDLRDGIELLLNQVQDQIEDRADHTRFGGANGHSGRHEHDAQIFDTQVFDAQVSALRGRIATLEAGAGANRAPQAPPPSPNQRPPRQPGPNARTAAPHAAGTGANEVQEAIAQIRRRQRGGQPHMTRPAPAPRDRFSQGTQNQDTQNQGTHNGTADGLVASIEGMSARLAGLEGRLKDDGGRQRDAHLVGSQIAALTKTVDQLCNTVSQTQDLTQLEARLADILLRHNGRPDPGFESLSGKVGELYDAVEKLAAYHVRQAELANGAPDPAPDYGVSGAQIEDSIRAMYDRLDGLEQTLSIPAPELERISDQVAALANSIGDGANQFDPAIVLERIDRLSSQLDTQSGAGSAGGIDDLRTDVESLRAFIANLFEPRFDGIEGQIAAIKTRLVDTGTPSSDPDAMEAQIRALTEKMDRAGAALELLVNRHPGADTGDLPRGDNVDLTAMEERLAAAITASGSAAIVNDQTFEAVRETMDRVDGRLNTLEGVLARLGPSDQPGHEYQTVQDTGPAHPAPPVPAASFVQDDRFADFKTTEAELTEGEQGPAAETENSPQRAQASAPRVERGGASPTTVEAGLPPKPTSELGPIEPRAAQTGHSKTDGSKTDGSKTDGSKTGAQSGDIFQRASTWNEQSPNADADSGADTRQSFIEAARQAARRNSQKTEAEQSTGGLFGKALARISAKAGAGARGKPKKGAKPETRKERNEPGLDEATDAEPQNGTEAAVDHSLDDAARAQGRDRPDSTEGFLSRHRRALLLGASVLAMGLMTLNLIDQRMGAEIGAPDATSERATLSIGENPIASSASPEIVPAAMRQVAGTAPESMEPVAAASVLLPESADMQGQLSPVVAEAVLTDPGLGGAAAIDTELTTASIPPSFSTEDGLPANIGPRALMDAARSGDPRAQFEVAAVLSEGKVVEKNLALAISWYERSAATGFAPAQYRLGNLYENGFDGQAANPIQARVWYEKAAEAGNRMAMHNLASLFADGSLETQDFSAAAQWFEQAAERGVRDSQFNLGMLYARGLGVAQDYYKSYVWFGLGALSGDIAAATARDDIARSLDADAIRRAKAEIKAWSGISLDIAANYAPIGTWDAGFDPGRAVTDADVVRQVQAVLESLGFDVGPADGVMGPQTANAIAKFEAATGMSETGAVNPRLLAVLGSQPV
ncbi:MAG: hypothetical protein GXP01_00880 [Alphaproteobacteria bacterium]|nr:hypothetical protein [Alphaproteobacteria bacterium]